MSCFWSGSIRTFLEVQNSGILAELELQHSQILCQPASIEQIRAWKSCFGVLRNNLSNISSDLGLIFEFVLPRERGRRPDIIILSSKQVIVLEFKDFAVRKSAHIDQVAAYARDLADYHKGSRGLNVVPILVLTKAGDLLEQVGDVTVCGPNCLSGCLSNLLEETDGVADIQEFVEADYEPLPSLVNAARILFKHEPLPQIYRAESAGIPETIKYLHELADEAISQDKNILALVTGVPGSGKSLVGLQFVYDRSTDGESNAVFLSGNGPLVEVFQYALKNRIFVQDVHGFLKQYGGSSSRLPGMINVLKRRGALLPFLNPMIFLDWGQGLLVEHWSLASLVKGKKFTLVKRRASLSGMMLFVKNLAHGWLPALNILSMYLKPQIVVTLMTV